MLKSFQSKVLNLALVLVMVGAIVLVQKPVVAQAACPTVTVTIEGSDYAPDVQQVLDRLNEIRQEAAQDYGLTYVPLKWSYSLEEIANIRAHEASLVMAHTRPNGHGVIDDMFDSSTMYGFAENLAWNQLPGEQSMMMAIEQWYDEKADYDKKLAGQPHGETGHYESIINPAFTHTGLSTFAYDDAAIYVTTAQAMGKFQNPGSVDETQNLLPCHQAVDIEFTPGYIQSLQILGPASLAVNDQGQYRAQVQFKDGFGQGFMSNVSTTQWVDVAQNDCGLDWSLTNGNGVLENQRVTGVQPGLVTLLAQNSTLNASKNIQITAAPSAEPQAMDPDLIQTGAGQSMTQGSQSIEKIKIAEDLDEFEGIWVDGMPLMENVDYTAISGSTIVALSPQFLERLAAGVHELEFRYTKGRVVSTTLTVTANEEVQEKIVPVAVTQRAKDTDSSKNPGTVTVMGAGDSTPETGDHRSLAMGVMLLIFSMILIIFVKQKYGSR